MATTRGVLVLASVTILQCPPCEVAGNKYRPCDGRVTLNFRESPKKHLWSLRWRCRRHKYAYTTYRIGPASEWWRPALYLLTEND